MSWVNVYVHVVFSTKNWYPYLNKEIRAKVFEHIKENAKLKGIKINEINGYTDHCHCLIFLSKEQSLARTIQLIKGESSYWINKVKLTEKHFKW
ncbi:MAG: transposase [Melioribacteraceae bacterium]|nr:transposase [Melioribacteraceae bacterium]